MAGQCLHDAFGFDFGVPDLDGTISRSCDYEHLVEYLLCEDAFDFPLMDVGQVVVFSHFVILALSQFLQ